MSDLIDRQAVIEILATMQGRCTSKSALIQNSKIWQQIKDMPSVDAVPVVRCKDCKYLDESLAVGSWDGACKYWKTHSTDYDWFCSNGKRREVTE